MGTMAQRGDKVQAIGSECPSLEMSVFDDFRYSVMRCGCARLGWKIKDGRNL